MSITSPTSSRPGLAAYDQSVRLDTAAIVTGLRDLLGAKLVAYIGHVGHTRSVREWADGQRAPGAEVVQRLRTAYHVAGILREREGNATIQSWFQGMNPQLDDDSPARLLREGPLDVVGPQVLSAARTFAAIG